MKQIHLVEKETPLSLPTSLASVESSFHTYLDNRVSTAHQPQPHTPPNRKRKRTPSGGGKNLAVVPHTPPNRKKKRTLSSLPSERLKTRKETKECLVELLEQVKTMESVELADKVKGCGSRFKFVTCGKHIASRQPLFRCGHRLCPYCASKRAKDTMKKYLPKMLAFVQHSPVPVTPCLLTLTLTHLEGETIKQAKARLYEAFRKLIRRAYWKEHFAGGLYSLESTVDKKGLWHCHLHAVVFRKKFVNDLALFRSEWKAVTVDSYILNLKLLTDMQSGLQEVLKYIVKPSDYERYTPEHVRQLLALRGEKMVGAFGEFSTFCRTYKPSDNDEDFIERFDYVEGDCCPKCDEPLFAVFLSDVEAIDFYRRLEMMPKGGAPKRE